MRITQNMMTRNYLRNMNTNLSRLAKVEERMTGAKYSKASENIADTSRALRVRQNLFDNESYQTSIRDVNARISAAESSLTSINDILVSAREQLMTKGIDDSKGAQRETIAQELDGMREEILQFANAQFADTYIFGGTQNAGAPFATGEDGRMTYNGVPVDDIEYDPDLKQYYTTDPDTGERTPVPENGSQYIDIGLGLVLNGNQVESNSAFPITFSGIQIFGCGKNANGTTNNVYNMLKDAADALRAEPFDRGALTEISNNLKDKTEDMRLTLTDIGTRCNFLDKAEERIGNDIFNLKVLQQKLEVADTATEALNWKVYSALMTATYQIGSQVIPMSLMDFIN